jgi:predicted nucleic acid-binding protein
MGTPVTAHPPPFLDTNVLLCLLSADGRRADRAERIVAAGGVISVQVLNEFASVASRKLAMPWPEIRDVLQGLRALCTMQPVTVEVHDRALVLAERHRFGIYDAAIVASALVAGCRTLYSEDLQDGRRFDTTLTVRNPFAAAG